jgi:two-component system sensor histidine kinase/response regulator
MEKPTPNGLLPAEGDPLKLRVLETQAANDALADREADRLRTLMMAARDLRGPIDAIHGIAGLLLDENLPAERRQIMVGDILRNSGQVLDLLDRLTEIVRIDTHTTRLELKPVDLRELVMERVEVMRRRAERKRMMIVSQFESLPRVPCDRDCMAQVLDNLIDNAIKFSPPDTRIWIDAYRLGVAAIVSVTDQGQGIPESELSRLFGTFSRTSVQPTAGEPGAGLGLSIVRRIVEEHDGVVGVETRVGRGSSFRVVLPFGRDEETKKKP